MGRMATDRERRVLAATNLEVRVAGSDSEPRIVGYGAVFNSPSEVMSDFFAGGFREYVAPGAFTKTLKDGADVRALLNHDPNFVIGRTKNGTLTLREDDKGLWYEATPPDTQWARDLIATMRRGDIDQSSFAFRTVRDRWGVGADDEGNEIDERWLLEAQLFDVSPVTYPAYPAATSDVRSILTSAGIDDAVLLVMERARRGQPLRDAHRSLLQRTIDHLSAYLASAAPVPPVDHPATPEPEPAPSGHSTDTRRGDPVYIDSLTADRLRKRLERVGRLA